MPHKFNAARRYKFDTRAKRKSWRKLHLGLNLVTGDYQPCRLSL